MIEKLERKYGKYGIRNLMKYVALLYILGFVVEVVSAAKEINLYTMYLSFDIDMILKGQIWRIVTFLIQPLDTSFFFMLIAVWLYYSIGSTLERSWGSFRFTLFYVSGVFFNILSAVFIYVVLLIVSKGSIHFTYPISLHYINLSMFLAFATMFSDVPLLLYFIIPIKIKYIAYLYMGLELYGLVEIYIKSGWLLGVCSTVVLIVSLLNFLIFFFGARKQAGHTFANYKRRTEFQNSYNRGMNGGYQAGVTRDDNGRAKAVITRHKCAVCGRTELSDDELEFRFCSKCDGNYEYCMDHLYTHTHVVREYKDQ